MAVADISMKALGDVDGPLRQAHLSMGSMAATKRPFRPGRRSASISSFTAFPDGLHRPCRTRHQGRDAAVKAALEEINSMTAQGMLQPIIDRRFGF